MPFRGNYGSEIKYQHPELGFNSRLDTLHAAVPNAKLKRLSAWNDQRRKAASHYHALLADCDGIQLPQILPENESVWHIYAIRLANRDRVLSRMHDAGIGVGIHYKIPVHLHGAFDFMNHLRGSFPNSEKSADDMLSLPLYPGITEAQQSQVVEILRAAR